MNGGLFTGDCIDGKLFGFIGLAVFVTVFGIFSLGCDGASSRGDGFDSTQLDAL